MKRTNFLALQLLLLLALAFSEVSAQSVLSLANGAVPFYSRVRNGLANHREAITAHMKQAEAQGHRVVQKVQQYIPPDLAPYLKKEVKDLAVKEGSRFAVKHPVETADIMDIASKARNLQKIVTSKVKEGRS